MADILFVTWDGGGNLPPALGIAAELHRRGDTVRFLGHARQRDSIETSGFRFEAYTRARPWSSLTELRGPQGALTISRMFVDSGPGEDLLASVDRERPDLVVMDCMSLGALRAADRAGLRRAVLVHTFYRYLTHRWVRGPIGLMALLNGLRPVRLWSAADLVLVATLRGLDPAGAGELPASIRYTGPIIASPSPSTTDNLEKPRILVSLSTVYFPGQTEALQSIMDALEGMPVHATVTTGDAVDSERLKAPANVELHRYLPHDEVMPAVSLVVGHGGHATTMRALAHDLPLIIVPMHPMLDQAMIGRAVQSAGAGQVIAKTASPGAIRSAIEEMLRDGAYRRAAAQLGAQIRNCDGAAMAADCIAELVPTGPR